MIRSIYDGRSLSVLNRLIEDRDRRPIEKYITHGDALFRTFRGYLLSLLFFCGLYFLFTLIPRIKYKKLQNPVLFLLVIVLIVGPAELFLRYFLPVRIGEITFANFQPSSNPDIVIEPRPGAGEFNSDGLRDYEYTREKPEGCFRVLVIGNSLAYGLRIGLDDTYAKQLEKKLNEHSRESRRYEIINMGVPGYRTIQTIARLKEKGLTYDPDLVIYGYWLDDITFSGLVPFYFDRANQEMSEVIHRLMSKNPLERKIKTILLESQIVRRGLLFIRDVYREKRYGTRQAGSAFSEKEISRDTDPRVADLYREFLDKIDTEEYADIPGADFYYAMYADEEDFRLWHDSLRDLSETCRDRGIECLLLMTPVIIDYPDGKYPWEGLHQFIRAVAKQYSIPSVDLTEEFAGYESHQLRAGDLEHPNALGHTIIADKLYEWIVNTTH